VDERENMMKVQKCITSIYSLENNLIAFSGRFAGWRGLGLAIEMAGQS
jgi:hypothetical protein